MTCPILMSVVGQIMSLIGDHFATEILDRNWGLTNLVHEQILNAQPFQHHGSSLFEFGARPENFKDFLISEYSCPL